MLILLKVVFCANLSDVGVMSASVTYAEYTGAQLLCLLVQIELKCWSRHGSYGSHL